MIIKKICLLVVGFFFLFSSNFIFASKKSYDNDVWASVSKADWMKFNAVYEDGVVKFSWNKFTLSNGDKWVYYKIMRDQKNANPVYPDNGHWKYLGDINTTSIVDESPLQGKTHYRVCAIVLSQQGKKYRHCSNVANVFIDFKNDNKKVEKVEKVEKNKESNKEISKELSKNEKTVLSDDMKLVVDNMLLNFINKVDEKFGSDFELKIEFYSNMLSVVDNILNKSNSKMKPAFEYLREKIEELLVLVELQKVLDI